MTTCSDCLGEGWVMLGEGGLDACGRCAREAEFKWLSERSESVCREGDRAVAGIEQVGPGGAGMVTAAAVWMQGEPVFELVVYPALLRAMPWYRGGRDVSVVHGVGRDGDKLTIESAGPHTLLARMTSRLDKFPPVMLRVRKMDHLRPVAHPPEPVAHRVVRLSLEITLPVWARPPVPLSAPVTSFGPLFEGVGR